jgi:hypothetical protein
MFATITHIPSLHKILSNTPRNHPTAAGVLCHFAVWCVLLVHSGRNIDAIMLKANGVFLEQSEAGKATEYEPARITSKNNISAFIQGKIVAACIRGGVATAKSVDC